MIGLPVLARLPWGWIGAAVAVLGALWWAYDAGRDAERAKWKAASIAAERAAQAKSAALQAQVDAAGAALSEKQQQIAEATRNATGKTKVYYVTHPDRNRACLDADRVQHIAEADAAAIEAASATK